jgi:hypothetical protein
VAHDIGVRRKASAAQGGKEVGRGFDVAAVEPRALCTLNS